MSLHSFPINSFYILMIFKQRVNNSYFSSSPNPGGHLSVHVDPKKLSKNSKSSKKKGEKNKAPSKDVDVVKQVPPSGQIAISSLKIFTLDELKTATGNFNMLLGKGDLGDLFLGWVNEVTYAPSTVGVGMAIAVKKLDPRNFQRHSRWQVNQLSYCPVTSILSLKNGPIHQKMLQSQKV